MDISQSWGVADIPADIVLLFAEAVGDILVKERSTDHLPCGGFPAIPLMKTWRSALLPLTRVSSSWHRAVTPLLVRHVSFYIYVGTVDEDTFLGQAFDFAVHLVPRYGNTVRSLDLTLEYRDNGVCVHQVDCHLAGILALLQHITSLVVEDDGSIDELPKTTAQLVSLKQPIRHLKLSKISCTSTIVECVHSCSKTLQTLGLEFNDEFEDRFARGDWVRILQAPHLHSLAIRDVSHDPISNLTSISDFAVPILRNLLLDIARPCRPGLLFANAAILESLALFQVDFARVFGQGTPDLCLTFPRLHRLVVFTGDQDCSPAVEAISRLRLPRIETLEVSGSGFFYLRLLPVIAKMDTLKTLTCGYFNTAPSRKDQSAFRFALSQISPEVAVTFKPEAFTTFWE